VLSKSECSLPEPAPATLECEKNDYIHLISDAGRNLQQNLTCVVSDDAETTTHNAVGDFSSASEDAGSDSISESESSEDTDKDEEKAAETIPRIEQKLSFDARTHDPSHCSQCQIREIQNKNMLLAQKLNTILSLMHNQGLVDEHLNINNEFCEILPHKTPCRHTHVPASNECEASASSLLYTEACDKAAHFIYLSFLRLVIKRKKNRAAKNRQRSAELCASMSRDASVTQHVKSIVEFYEKQYMETDANKTRTRLATQQNHELFLLMQKYECLQNSRLQTSSP